MHATQDNGWNVKHPKSKHLKSKRKKKCKIPAMMQKAKETIEGQKTPQ
jgi:hypothetical protein